MKDKVPYIDKNLLIYLEDRFKSSEYEPNKTTIEDIAFQAGQLKVVKHLQNLYNKQDDV
jgi:hypothetical protein